MKKSQIILAASAALLIGMTSCKTTQATDQQQKSQTETTQKVNRNYQPLALDRLNGEWIIDQALGKPVVGDGIVNIIFDINSQQVLGNNGCNTFNGTLTLGEDCVISFTNCITTLKACQPKVTERNVMQAIGATTHYNTVKNDNNEIAIQLLDESGNVVANLSRQMLQELGGYWEIIEVNGKKVKHEEMPTIVLDIESGKLTGNSGCNIMNGNIKYESSKNNHSITFDNIASTRRMCAPDAMEVEDAVLDALNKVNSFRITSNKNVQLYSTSSEKISLLLQRK